MGRLTCLAAMFLLGQPVFATTCVNTGNACSWVGAKSVAILVVRVVESASKPGRFRAVVEEPLQNVPQYLGEIEIDSFLGWAHQLNLRPGDRWVVITEARPPYSIHPCSDSFALAGNEHLLDALKGAIRGGSTRITGVVRSRLEKYERGNPLAGATVTALGIGGRFEALTNSFGQYTILLPAGGRFRMQVTRPGYLQDEESQRRRTAKHSLAPGTNGLELEFGELGVAEVTSERCQIWDLALWPSGRIQGTVRHPDGRPADSGLTVQAFAFDRNNQRQSQPLRTGTTAANGTYTIAPLPPGPYVVGINAAAYEDADIYPPTLHAGGARLQLGDSSTLDDVDLVLPAARIPAKLRIQVLGPAGRPFPEARFSLRNLEGVQRYFSRELTDANGEITVPTFIGEKYLVEASAVSGSQRFGTKLRVDVERSSTRLTLTLRAE